jgi:hypothetical protein
MSHFEEKYHHESQDKEKERREIERLCEGEPEAISILSGGIAKRDRGGENIRYTSGAYKDPDVAGLLSGGKARVIAAAEITHFYPQATVITNSKVYENAPSDARIMEQELERYGVPSTRILLQENSYSTFTELIELVKYVAENGWHHVAVVTNEFQIPRAQEFLRQIDTLRDPYGASEDPVFRAAIPAYHALKPKIVFVPAEAVLPLRDEHYQGVIDRAKASPEWEERVKREVSGLQKLQAGTYWKEAERKTKEPIRLE